MPGLLVHLLINDYKDDLSSEERIFFKDKILYQVGFTALLQQELLNFPGMTGINDWLNSDKTINMNKINDFTEVWKVSSLESKQIYLYYLEENQVLKYLRNNHKNGVNLSDLEDHGDDEVEDYEILNEFYKTNLNTILLNNHLEHNLDVNMDIQTKQKL